MAAPLGVSVHLQDDPDNCGQACAQMATAFLNGGLVGDQNAFQRDPKLGHSGWATSPEQLADLVNDKLQGSEPRYYVEVVPTFDTAMAAILACVDGSRKPAVALVHGGDHWVVVFGITRSRPGTKVMVHARNPLPDRELVKSLHPRSADPHAAHKGGDACRTWDVQFGGGGSVPVDEVVDWNEWQNFFFTSCSIPPAHLQSKFVAVLSRLTEAKTPERIEVPAAAGGTRRLSDSELAERTWANLQHSGLLDAPGWREALRGSVPARERRRDINVLDSERAFALLDLTAQGEGVLAGSDPRTGELLWARLNPARVQLESIFRPEEELRERSGLETEASIAYVWKVCRETLYSPYFPLARVTQKDRTQYYIRLLDNRRFEELS